jgi:hypothetical protein
MPLHIRPVTRSGHAGPVTMCRITRGPPCWMRPHGGMTSSQVFVRCRMGRRVSLPVVLSPLDQRLRRRPRAMGGVFAFAPTTTDALTNGSFGGWSYKYPQPPHFNASKDHSNQIVTSERDNCVHLSSCAWIAFSSFFFLVSNSIVIKARDTNCVVILVGT